MQLEEFRLHVIREVTAMGFYMRDRGLPEDLHVSVWWSLLTDPNDQTWKDRLDEYLSER